MGTTDQYGSGSSLVSYSINGSDPQKVTPPGGIDIYPSVANNGKLVFERVFAPSRPPSQFGKPLGITTKDEPIGLNPTIQMINLDGTGLTQMAPNGFTPSIDLAGDKFAYVPNASHIFVEQVANKATTDIPLPPNDGIIDIAMSPDGNTVYALLSNVGDASIYAMPSNGSGATPIVIDFGFTSVGALAISPDGTELAVIAAGTPSTIIRVGVHSGITSQIPLPLPGAFTDHFAYGADGKSFVVGSTNGIVNGGLWVGPIDFPLWERITPETSIAGTPAWTPFVKDRVLIAPGGGLLGTRACGVIFGQSVMAGTTSVIAVDVTTPSSVVLTAQSGSPLDVNNLVFSIDADNITKLAYTNGTAWRGIRAIGSGTPVTAANGALVSLNGVTGEVVSILPFSGTRGKGTKPTISDRGSLRTFTGTFLAAYDKDGKNVAPNGTSSVTLNTATGTLTVD